ncbi:MAG: homoserine dehydrogenase [Clostridioides sp.]|jgi:homoserine dehydrogenase|nr:homoserine dehydrogenase [Clostridioides sp.]
MVKQKINIGLLGLGTVGSGVPVILETNKEKITQITGADISIKKALVRNEERKAFFNGKYNFELTTDFDDILNDDNIQIVVELIGGIEPAKTYITKALEKGKCVVTANKDLLAQYGSTLVSTAKRNKADLFFEGSVAGGIPILRTIANSLSADNINKVFGIVNGTTNYILTQMSSESKSYAEALKEAQELGFAESDPTNDVEGIDAAYKMVILSQFAFGMNITIDQVDVVGITNLSTFDIEVARKLGYEIKLIGLTQKINESLSVEVAPMLVPIDHPLASVRNEFNAIFISSYGVGESMYYGPGAGSKPTATSVVSDVIQVVKNLRLETSGHRFNAYKDKTKYSTDDEVFGKYYFSIELQDKSGQMLLITQIFADIGVSFEQILQPRTKGDIASAVMTTHACSKAQMKEVAKRLSELPNFKVLKTLKILE